ncbi:MAG: DUF1552 domain-containing protein [Lentisphaeraceae bacterium]|nr:DUF1552 domain-containing protein [Lentisphaeraceae bacterium]
MNFITKKSLDRRKVLRGLSSVVALPLLDAMIPAATALEKTSAKPIKRLCYVYVAMGSNIKKWTPTSKTNLDVLSPILTPLEPIKNKLNVFTNMELRPAYPGTHATSNSTFLSGVRAKITESSDYRLGTTVDQMAAKVIGQETALPSLELSMDMMDTVGQCDNGYACVYQNNLSWSGPTTPLPSEAHPRLVFEKLFGEGGTKQERQLALRKRASLLDFIKDDMNKLKKEISKSDRAKVDHYLDSIREVERRIQIAEKNINTKNLKNLESPLGAPEVYGDHARLMFDLQVLALQGDVTRIITFQMVRETSNRTYPEIGVPEAHHPLTHNRRSFNKVAKINTHHVSLLSEYLQKLDKVVEGDMSLLDQSIVMYGSGMGDPSVHDHKKLPILQAGGAAFGIKGNRHFVYKKPEPLANLHQAILNKAGVDVKYSDSTTPVSL